MSKNFEEKFQTTYTQMGLTANNMDNTSNSRVVRSSQTQTKRDYHKVININNNVSNSISNSSELSNDIAITKKLDRVAGLYSPLQENPNYSIDGRDHEQIYENFDELNFYHDINKYYPIISASKSADCINIIQVQSSISEKQSNENIYENVCENCGQIYSNDKCLVCIDANLKRKSDPVKRSQSNLFSGFIDSIRQKTKIKEKIPKPKRKLEIIHNVDSVFKTNKSFDLSEICRLKANVNKWADHKNYNKNIYGKLRPYDEYHVLSHEKLIKLPDVDLMQQQPPVNESNFAHLDALTTFPVCTQSTPDLVEHEENHFFANDDEKQTQHTNESLYENLADRVYRKGKNKKSTKLKSDH